MKNSFTNSIKKTTSIIYSALKSSKEDSNKQVQQKFVSANSYRKDTQTINYLISEKVWDTHTQNKNNNKNNKTKSKTERTMRTIKTTNRKKIAFLFAALFYN